ncbi:unnamed protein product, partial [Polarella glacialis]
CGSGTNTSPVSSPKGRNSISRLVHLKPSGVLVRPAEGSGNTASEVSLCALLGKDSVRLLSGDLLGEKLLFWRTLENLLFVLEQLCPFLPAGFGPPLLAHQERCLQGSAGDVGDGSGSPLSSPGRSSVADEPPQSDSELEVQLVEVDSSAGEGGRSVVFD